MQNNSRFEKVGVTAPRTSQINLSNKHLTTLDLFRLQPIYTKEMIPGDTFNVNIRSLINAAPLSQRVYGSFRLDLHAFFVPNRLIWSDWENYYLGNSRSGRSGSAIYTPPSITNTQLMDLISNGRSATDNPFTDMHRILSSLGYPIQTIVGSQQAFPITYKFSSLPIRAYERIWWDYYRDSVNIEEFTKSVNLPSTSGGTESGTSYNAMKTRYRCFKKDYISTILASPQVGTPSSARIQNDGWSSGSSSNYALQGNGAAKVISQSNTQSNQWLQSLSIPVLRAANASQRFLERMNLSGTRPLERIFAFFGINSQAVRHDMVEFVGAASSTIGVDGLVNSSSEINAQQFGANAYNAFLQPHGSSGAAMGFQQGFANAGDQSDTFSYHATEHGFFMVIASIVPDYSRPFAIDRMLIRGISTPNSDVNDYYTPDFDGIGYQPVTLAEVATPSANAGSEWQGSSFGGQYDPNQLVGYQPQYEDYRISRDIVSGDFLENHSKFNLQYCAFMQDLSQILTPSQVKAGLLLSTADNTYRKKFDEHFVIVDPSYDHFIANFSIVNDAIRPITSAELPTELSNLANQDMVEISNGGVRL